MKASTCKIKIAVFCTGTTLKWTLQEDLGTVHVCFASLFSPVLLIPQLDFSSHHTLWSSHGADDCRTETSSFTRKLLFERLEFPQKLKSFETNLYYLVWTCSSKRNWHNG